jgi:hypothetical protein
MTHKSVETTLRSENQLQSALLQRKMYKDFSVDMKTPAALMHGLLSKIGGNL